MPRPLRKPHEVKVRLSDGDLAALERMAGGRPLGPAIVAAALGDRPQAAPPGESVSPLAALEAWRLRWLPGLRRTRANVGVVMAALTAIEKELRT